MNRNTFSLNQNPQKRPTGELNASSRLRFFYILMLLLIILSLMLRLSGARRSPAAQGGGGTAARILVFHHADGNSCENLVIAATGNAVLTNCGNGIEKQYVLSASERTELQVWIDRYSPVNYDHTDPGQTGGILTQLYLNGTGQAQANNSEIQQLIDFAGTLVSKITVQS